MSGWINLYLDVHPSCMSVLCGLSGDVSLLALSGYFSYLGSLGIGALLASVYKALSIIYIVIDIT